MNWDKFINNTFLDWDSVDHKIIQHIKNNFLTLTKKDIKKLNITEGLKHHISIRLEYLLDHPHIRPS